MSRRALPLFVLACALGSSVADADTFSPGSAKDPRVRNSEFMAGNGQYLSATALLLQVQSEQPQQRLGPEFYRELGEDALGFGMPQRAEVIFREQIASTNNPLDLGHSRLRLAEFYYQRGYYPKAVAELESMRANLPHELTLDWEDLLSRTLLASGRYGAAVEVLNNSDLSAASPFMRYNLGVALLADGRAGQGVNVLDNVGQMRPNDPETLALRDKVNLGLGYHYLRLQDGGTAIPLFSRVRSVGPYSDRALLGLGWAYLAPQGDTQRKAALGNDLPPDNAVAQFSTIGVLLRPGFVDPDILYRRNGLAPLKLTKADKDRQAALQHALVPWVELIGRDPMDPAVQEGMLAIPFALDRLGAHAQAQQYYERAIDALEQTHKRLDEAEDHVRSGRMINTIVKRDADAETGWTWKLKDLPDAAETFYLQGLLADNHFQEALKDFRDVRLLQRALISWKERMGKLEGTFTSRSRPDTAPAGAPANWTPPSVAEAPRESDAPDAESEAAHRMRLENRIASPVADNGAGQSQDPGAAVPLKLAAAPQRFDGPYEKMKSVQDRADLLLPKLAAVELAQRAVLETLALNDLDAQKALNHKYLVESRFALARVYDQQLKGDQ